MDAASLAYLEAATSSVSSAHLHRAQRAAAVQYLRNVLAAPRLAGAKCLLEATSALDRYVDLQLAPGLLPGELWAAFCQDEGRGFKPQVANAVVAIRAPRQDDHEAFARSAVEVILRASDVGLTGTAGKVSRRMANQLLGAIWDASPSLHAASYGRWLLKACALSPRPANDIGRTAAGLISEMVQVVTGGDVASARALGREALLSAMFASGLATALIEFVGSCEAGGWEGREWEAEICCLASHFCIGYTSMVHHSDHERCLAISPTLHDGMLRGSATHAATLMGLRGLYDVQLGHAEMPESQVRRGLLGMVPYLIWAENEGRLCAEFLVYVLAMNVLHFKRHGEDFRAGGDPLTELLHMLCELRRRGGPRSYARWLETADGVTEYIACHSALQLSLRRCLARLSRTASQ